MTILDGREKLVSRDGREWRQHHADFRRLAELTGEWAGIPLPVEGFDVRLEDRHDNRDVLERILNERNHLPPDGPLDRSCGSRDIFHVVNGWWSARRHCWVYLVCEEGDPPRYRAVLDRADRTAGRRLTFALGTLGVSQVWSMDAERRAQDKLRTMLPPHLFEMYCQPEGTMVRVVTRTGGGYVPGSDRTSLGGPQYGYREVPIEQLAVGDRVVSYTEGSSRLRRVGASVRAIAVRDYDGPLIEIETSSGLRSSYTPEHLCYAVLGEAITGKHVVYLMRRGDQFRIGRAAGRYSSQGAQWGPYGRALNERADAIWILSVHDDKEGAALAEILTAHRFNLPTICFEAGSDRTLAGLFWAKLGANTAQGEACLTAFGRLLSAPLWDRARGGMYPRRVSIVAAANLLDGMQVLAADSVKYHGKTAHLWTTGAESIRVTRSFYSGRVWSLDVEEDRSYVADGIVTHNCLTGSFLWSSERSRVSYLLRRCRPTVAMVPSKRGPDLSGESMRILAVLCLHPLGYYAETWAGSMVPTDDVIAHLTWIKSDEHGFWRRANQHNSQSAEAGL